MLGSRSNGTDGGIDILKPDHVSLLGSQLSLLSSTQKQQCSTRMSEQRVCGAVLTSVRRGFEKRVHGEPNCCNVEREVEVE